MAPIPGDITSPSVELSGGGQGPARATGAGASLDYLLPQTPWDPGSSGGRPQVPGRLQVAGSWRTGPEPALTPWTPRGISLSLTEPRVGGACGMGGAGPRGLESPTQPVHRHPLAPFPPSRVRQHLVQLGHTALEFGRCQRPLEREGRAQQNGALALKAVGWCRGTGSAPWGSCSSPFQDPDLRAAGRTGSGLRTPGGPPLLPPGQEYQGPRTFPGEGEAELSPGDGWLPPAFRLDPLTTLLAWGSGEDASHTPGDIGDMLPASPLPSWSLSSSP